MAVALITSTDSFGFGFNQINENAKQQIIDAQFINGNLILTKFNTGTIVVPIPVNGSAGTSGGSGFTQIILNGDVVGSSSTGIVSTTISNGAVTSAKILDGAVTFNKIQTITGNTLLGRSGTNGLLQEITLGTNLSFSGSTLNATGGGNSGITSIVLSGAVTGSSTTGLVETTLNNGIVTYNKIQTVNVSKILGRGSSSAGNVEEISISTGLTLSGTTLSNSYGNYQTAGLASITYVNSQISNKHQTIVLSGAVTGSGTGGIVTTLSNDIVTTAKILHNAVTYNKLQTITSAKILGSVSGSTGLVGEISIGTGLNLNSGTLSNSFGNYQTAGLASITYVNSQITSATSGLASTIYVNNAVANKQIKFQLTGDVTGSAGSGTAITTIASNAVTTSKILDSNITTAKLASGSVTYSKIQTVSANKILGRSATSGIVQELTLGTGLSITGTTLNASTSGGGGGSSYTFSNGLTLASGNVKLGGSLVNNTTINGLGPYGFTFGTMKNFTVSVTDSGDTTSYIDNTLTDSTNSIFSTMRSIIGSVKLSQGDISTGKTTTLSIELGNSTFTDNSTTGRGLKYADDYSSFFTDRHLIDKYYVDHHVVTAGFIAPDAVTNTTIANNAVTTSKIADSNVTTAKLANGSVTYVKMQSVGANKLLGNAGTASLVEEITLGTGLSFSGSTLNVSGAGTISASNGLTLSGSYIKQGGSLVDTDTQITGGLTKNFQYYQISNFTVTKGTNIRYDSSNEIRLSTTNLNLNGTNMLVTIYPSSTSGALRYAGDYSGQYTNRSLVDKGYVTNAIAASIVSGSNGSALSTRGVIWHQLDAATSNNWTSVCYGNDLFVAVASSGTGTRVMTSPDGKLWTTRTSAADIAWNQVIWSGTLFVAVATSGTTNCIMTSPDGITWTQRTTPNTNVYYSVAYGAGIYVAVAATGTGNRVMYSSDAITWTAGTSPADNNWYSVCYGNGKFVAVAGSGTNRVMTSTDGMSWSTQSASTANTWISVAYGNGLYVAGSQDGTGTRIMTSPDGVTWTTRTNAINNNKRGIVYANGIWIIVSNGGVSSDPVETSLNGVYWASRTSANTGGYTSVCYGNGLAVAVSNGISGTPRVQIS